jgi:hypothetical protein
MTATIFQRKSLNQIITVPESLTSVYVVERHIWANGGDQASRAARQVEQKTVEEFLIDPVRSFLNDFFRQLSAPYFPERKDNPIGQGWWVQAEFGSGKSHLLSFLGALAMGNEAVWKVIQEKEQKAGMGKRESLYNFYEGGLAKKNQTGKGVFVAVKTLVGYGGGGVGLANADRSLEDYILDAVSEQFFFETGRSLPIYPTQILADRFLNTDDLELYRARLAKFLKNPKFFDEEAQEEPDVFLDDLRDNQDPAIQRDCGQRLWDFYTRDLGITPRIPIETEDVLRHMVKRLLEEGYAGLLLILDEVSLYMKDRTDSQRAEDEKALVVLSNRLAKMDNLPVWTVCAAQQAIESTMSGVLNIIARERLDLVPLLNQKDNYYDIALARVREVTNPGAIDQYYEDYKRAFSWPSTTGSDQFKRFFPFYPPSVDVLRQVSYNLTTIRSALYFMLQTLKSQTRRKSTELISLWALFDDVVNYEEDPSGTTRSIASIRTKFPNEWRAFDLARQQINAATKGYLKVYRSRCEKIVKTLFLYHVANMAPNGLSAEELMNTVMEWRDHDGGATGGQTADLQDNLDHYENLLKTLDLELVQVEKVGAKYRFNPAGKTISPAEIFQKFRAEAAQDENQRRQAWEQLLDLDGWKITTHLMTLDLASGLRSIFSEIAPASQTDITIKWHGREISGRVYMRDLLSIARRSAPLPNINSPATGLDYAMFISSTPCAEDLDVMIKDQKDPRVLFWSPDALSASEQSLLVDFAAYRRMVAEYVGKDTEDARIVLEWVKGQLSANLGAIYRIIPDSYGRGRIAAQDHTQMAFAVQGELPAILTTLVTQVLDTVYLCREMEFDAPAPFNDVNAVNVINGIVKVGLIPRGAKPTKEISAAQNYGFALQIMRRPNDHKLDLRDCRYTRDLSAWIEEKLGDTGGRGVSAATLPADTVYKNFMGINGPGAQHYGLSKRMVQMYLLCLVREGKIRITLSGKNLPAEVVDYSNIAGVDFKAAVLDAFYQVQRLKPPEGWEVLAPFAAVILGDQNLLTVHEDADIQDAIQRLVAFKDEQLKPIQNLQAGMADLFDEIQQPNPLAERLPAWEKFLNAQVDTADPIPYLRNALEKAFGYQVYQDDQVEQEDVDDLATRKAEIEQARSLLQYSERIRAAYRYAGVVLPEEPALTALRAAFDLVRLRMASLPEYLSSETRLLNELVEPAAEAIQSYMVRYLQAFDQMISVTEQTRLRLRDLKSHPHYRTLAALERVPQLASGMAATLSDLFVATAQSSDLFPAHITRNDVERELANSPQPAGCPLTLQNAMEWIATAERCLADGLAALQSALRDKATLLFSDALRTRLAQGKGEAFIDALLGSPSVQALEETLVEHIAVGSSGLPVAADEIEQKLELLRRYLQRITVRKVRLSDFQPEKHTLEQGDVEPVVQAFRSFLASAFHSDAPDEYIIVEIE